jgi:hypothetical protein
MPMCIQLNSKDKIINISTIVIELFGFQLNSKQLGKGQLLDFLGFTNFP